MSLWVTQGMFIMQKKYMRQMGTVDAKIFFYVDSAAKLARKSESEREIFHVYRKFFLTTNRAFCIIAM